MTAEGPEGDLIGTGLGGLLTSEEDDDLRQLTYLAELGQLSEQAYERFVWLSLRDRRLRIQEK